MSRVFRPPPKETPWEALVVSSRLGALLGTPETAVTALCPPVRRPSVRVDLGRLGRTVRRRHLPHPQQRREAGLGGWSGMVSLKQLVPLFWELPGFAAADLVGPAAVADRLRIALSPAT